MGETIRKPIESPYLRGYRELGAYLGGITVELLSRLRGVGLPYHKINTVYLYDKDEVRNWINSRKNLLEECPGTDGETEQEEEVEEKEETPKRPLKRIRIKAQTRKRRDGGERTKEGRCIEIGKGVLRKARKK